MQITSSIGYCISVNVFLLGDLNTLYDQIIYDEMHKMMLWNPEELLAASTVVILRV